MISDFRGLRYGWPGVMGVERVTRIELALSAWEAVRLRPLGALTCQVSSPLVAVTDPRLPWLMAR